MKNIKDNFVLQTLIALLLFNGIIMGIFIMGANAL